MLKLSKKTMAIVISAILVISTISGFFIIKSIIQEKAEVPEWEVGDNWRFIVSHEETRSNATNDYDYEVTVWSNNSFGEEEFYEMSGYQSLFLGGDLISKRDLCPIKLIDYENKTFNRNGMELDFPLYHGKKWAYKYEDAIESNYSVEQVSNINVPAGTFDGFKITKSEGNNTKSITYYSPEVEFVFMKFIVANDLGGNRTIKLHSFGNIELERKLSTVKLNNKYNATLETWEVKYFRDWYIQYRLFYMKDGNEFACRFHGAEKQFLDNIINYTSEDDKILCWWNYGHMIRGYTGREVIIDGPSEKLWHTTHPWYIQNWNDDIDVANVSKALTGSPEEAIVVMSQYNATLILVGPDDYLLSVDNMGVYSAILEGANKNQDEYYEIMAVLDNGKLVSLEEAATGYYMWDGWSTKIVYKESYYDSMIYRARFGYCGADVGLEDGTGNPGISEEMNDYPIMPARNLTNFKIVYRTAYWNPYPPKDTTNHTDAWTEVDYWDAYEKQESGIGTSDFSDRSNLYQGKNILRLVKDCAIIGTIKRNDGMPYSGIRVTAQDEYGAPRTSTITDSNGKYSLKAPCGNVKLIVSEGTLEHQRTYTLTEVENVNGAMTILVAGEDMKYGLIPMVCEARLCSCELFLSEEKTENNVITYQNFTEPAGMNYTGRLYKDLNRNNEFDSGDTIFVSANITLTPNKGGANYTVATNQTGHFSFIDVPRGIYSYELKMENHTTNRTYGSKPRKIFFDWDDPDVQENIGIPLVNITGRVSNSTIITDGDYFSNNGHTLTTNISGVRVTMRDKVTNLTYEVVTDQYGKFTFANLLPGAYVLTCSHELFYGNEIQKILPTGKYGSDVLCDFKYLDFKIID